MDNDNLRKPLVSVIMPCYNVEEWITEAIESALAQTYPKTEVIVVDDCSTDKSYELACAFKRNITLLRNDENRGAGPSRNRGLALSSGNYIQFWDADDILTPDCVLKKVEALSETTEEGSLISSDLRLMPETGDTTISFPWHFNYDLASMLRGGAPGTPVALYPKEMLLSIGGFREHLCCAEDYDLNLRLVIECGAKFIRNNHLGGYIRERKTSQSRTAGEKMPIAKLDILKDARIALTERGMLNQECECAIAHHLHGIAIQLWRFRKRTSAVETAKLAYSIDRNCYQGCYKNRYSEVVVKRVGFENFERIRSIGNAIAKPFTSCFR